MDRQLEAILERTGRLPERQQKQISGLLADALDLAEKTGKSDRTGVYRAVELALDLAENAPRR